MKVASLALCLLYTAGSLVQAAPTHNNTEAEATKQLNKWQKQYDQYIKASLKTRQTGCTNDNIVKRAEWGSLSAGERKNYIKAVQCLTTKPAKISKSEAPGARSRFDDWDAVHIKLTNNVHFSGLFLHFHRYFLWLYEKALQDECGYKGTQPYWDWTLSWQDPSKSTVFDGSDTSMGSNGKYIPNRNGTAISAFGLHAVIPPATGGGCVYSGPFQNHSVNLGPVAYAPYGPDGGLGYYPRCLARDLAPGFSNQTKPSDVVHVIRDTDDLYTFDDVFEGLTGVHAGGHFQMGGTGIDAFASPGDPAFYLHHAQVDRVWTLWQDLKPEERRNQVFGTSTAFNNPPSANITLDTEVDFDVLAPKKKISDLVSTVDGPFCYQYV
ncbi:uncharacterized protein KY384_000294 [Bacidia gigantensis]|uniref:uncharacterized protein n=1 Tax=Bacidia gigantensis TaxID=2732470 RepID=UPI001D053C6C|nr:uncharacterized protein KY384_000294 [Bacidia gigantensis]KAG8526301.1 hypothetical protein KY384_000294 [Bacidia gigantensis]